MPFERFGLKSAVGDALGLGAAARTTRGRRRLRNAPPDHHPHNGYDANIQEMRFAHAPAVRRG